MNMDTMILPAHISPLKIDLQADMPWMEGTASSCLNSLIRVE